MENESKTLWQQGYDLCEISPEKFNEVFASLSLSAEQSLEFVDGYQIACIDQFFDNLKGSVRELPNPKLIAVAMTIINIAFDSFVESLGDVS